MFSAPEEQEKKYSSKIQAPVYEPKNKQPFLLQLYDNAKTKRLLLEIEKSNVTEEEKHFLAQAAQRHTVFNYENIADYYAHATKEMQELMENSALVIIDFEKAVELGYIKLCTQIQEQYLTEYGE
jgi:hypothetical protein